ncbi:hypothetical protein BDW74DRAFT_182863 [Aspergillus multicolor]|uniref:uncharacterized protein n=1 Tax=Aspergillus multicolor TaxID=41759 RepID=UPI003CCE3233
MSLEKASYADYCLSSSNPHPLYPATRGFQYTGRSPESDWRTHIYEYEKEPEGDQMPHVVLLAHQSCNGHDGSIALGELVAIVTTMKSRASQPRGWKKEDNEDDGSDDGYEDPGPKECRGVNIKDRDVLFLDERKLPVLMVSLLGSQHERLYYACMDGLDIVIRQPKLYSFEKKNYALLDFFSCFLLSEPIAKDPSPLVGAITSQGPQQASAS